MKTLHIELVLELNSIINDREIAERENKSFWETTNCANCRPRGRRTTTYYWMDEEGGF